MAKSPQAQVARFTADPGFEKGATTIQATSVTDDLGGGRTAAHYRADFQGLEPGTRYCYRVGDGETWSEWNSFRTASAKPEAFRFLYFGDAQNSIKSLWSRTVRTAVATVPDARFMTHAGDLLAEGYDDRLWGEWTDALSFISATIPNIPAPGNHDLHRPPGRPDSKGVFSVSPLWRSHFALPANGPDIEEMRGQTYYVDYQGVRMVALDVNVWANEDFDAGAKQRVQAKQLEWLNRVLGNNPNHWTIVVQHQTIYAMAKGREYTEMREALAPLYEKYHVDLVLQGHDHTYARSHKIAGGKVVAPEAAGVIYAISVSGPKMYEQEDRYKPLMAATYEKKQFFQAIEVAPERLKYTSYSIDGAVADAFELDKPGTSSTYVNHAPEQKRVTRLMKKYALPGEGSWDYLTVDAAARRLYVSHNSQVHVVDLNSGSVVGSIPAKGAHGIALAPESGRGFITNGTGDNVTVFDLKTLQATGSTPTGKKPDAIVYDDATRRVFANNGNSSSSTVIDSADGRVLGTVELGGAPESSVADGKGFLFTNLEDKSELVKIDARAMKVVARWRLAPCEAPSSLGIDRASRRLFVGCRNHLMAMVDADSGKVIQTETIGDHVDATAFDGETKLIYFSNGDGTVNIFHEESAQHVSAVETVRTQPGAKTMALDLKTHQFVVSAAEYAGGEGGIKGKAMKPGSFAALVFGK